MGRDDRRDSALSPECLGLASCLKRADSRTSISAISSLLKPPKLPCQWETSVMQTPTWELAPSGPIALEESDFG